MSTHEALLDTYTTVVELWESFCKVHSDLYELTCDEYTALLSSDINSVEAILEEKNIQLEKISILESDRTQLISDINLTFFRGEQKIKKVSDLLRFFNDYEKNNNTKVLEKYNLLLINIIEKIKDQNKNNQIFLNKAINSLSEMRRGFSGKSSYQTYSASGKAITNVTRK